MATDYNNENTCKYCGCTNRNPCTCDHGGPCCWVTLNCDVCSKCASKLKVKIKLGGYRSDQTGREQKQTTRPPANDSAKPRRGRKKHPTATLP